MEIREIKELLLNELTREQKYSLNTKQAGESLELFWDENSVGLDFLDLQYEFMRVDNHDHKNLLITILISKKNKLLLTI